MFSILQADADFELWPWVVGLLLLIFVVFLIFVSKFINLWIQTTLTNARIGLFTLGMMARVSVTGQECAASAVNSVTVTMTMSP